MQAQAALPKSCYPEVYKHVYAIDVGEHGQLSPKIAKSPRVTSLEKTNARYLSAADIPEPFSLSFVMSLSFLSPLALPPAMSLAKRGAGLIALIKPQFEVGRDGLDKGGIVKNAALRLLAVADI